MCVFMGNTYQVSRLEYQKSLKNLKNETLELGFKAKTALTSSLSALETLDQTMAKNLINTYSKSHFVLKEREIEDYCIKLIALQSPVSKDLRLIEACYKTSTEFKKIANVARRINQNTLAIEKFYQFPDIIQTIEQMATKVIKMLDVALSSFQDLDIVYTSNLRSLDEDEDAIDNLYKQTLTEITHKVVGQQDVKIVNQLLHLLLLVQHIEHAGDHALSIAERIHYVITGERIL